MTGHVTTFEVELLKDALAEVTRLRAERPRAGWAEAIESAAKVADDFGAKAAEELKTITDYTRQSRVNFHSAAIVIAARIRALRPSVADPDAPKQEKT